MAENFYQSFTHHFLEIYGLLAFIFHGIPFLLKQVRPALEEARALYLYVRSWKDDDEVRALSKAEPKT